MNKRHSIACQRCYPHPVDRHQRDVEHAIAQGVEFVDDPDMSSDFGWRLAKPKEVIKLNETSIRAGVVSPDEVKRFRKFQAEKKKERSAYDK